MSARVLHFPRAAERVCLVPDFVPLEHPIPQWVTMLGYVAVEVVVPTEGQIFYDPAEMRIVRCGYSSHGERTGEVETRAFVILEYVPREPEAV